jgi:GTP-binding protein
MFVDEVDILVAAGDGGRGCVSFRREKFVPRGGPNGGDGGPGGSVHLLASPHHNTLVGYRFHPEHRAGRGAHGQGSNRTGRAGRNLVLEVPPGTVVHEIRPGGEKLLGDLAVAGDRLLVASGGKGGSPASPRRPTVRRVGPNLVCLARSSVSA